MSLVRACVRLCVSACMCLCVRVRARVRTCVRTQVRTSGSDALKCALIEACAEQWSLAPADLNQLVRLHSHPTVPAVL